MEAAEIHQKIIDLLGELLFTASAIKAIEEMTPGTFPKEIISKIDEAFDYMRDIQEDIDIFHLIKNN